MTKIERGNIKSSPSRVTRDIMVQDNIIKEKGRFFNYHGMCYHDSEECNFVHSHRKHVQPTHYITEQQRLWQLRFVKDTKKKDQKVWPDRQRDQGSQC
eukprot:8932699-Ditylum_brightwellii.AAC.1